MEFLVTHETRTAAFTALAHNSPHAQTKETDPLRQADRAHMDRVLASARSRVHVHGHHRTRFAAPLDG